MSREGIEPPVPEGTCFTDRLDDQLSDRLVTYKLDAQASGSPCAVLRESTRSRVELVLLEDSFSSTGGSRTRKHEGLNFAAVPVRVPCQRSFSLLCFVFSFQDASLGSHPFRFGLSLRILKASLFAQPGVHFCGVRERLFFAVCQLDRELIGTHRSSVALPHCCVIE